MARYRDEYDYTDDDEPDGGRDALVGALEGEGDPFKDMGPMTRDESVTPPDFDNPDPYAWHTLGADEDIPVDTPDQPDYFSPDSGAAASPPPVAAPDQAAPQNYAYQGSWGGFDPARMQGGANDSTDGNAKYWFTEVMAGFDPARIVSDPAYRQQALDALNANSFGSKFYLSEDGDFMATQPGEAYDGAYMGVRDGEYRWLTSAGNPVAQGREAAGDPTLSKSDALIAALQGGSAMPQAAPATAAPITGTNAPITGSSATTTSNTATTTGGGGMNDTIRAYIEKILGMNPYAVDQNDPNIMAAQTAYERAQERALQKNRGAMAERMNASGTMGGGLDSWVSHAYQNMGEENAAHNADLVLSRQKEQLGQLENALKVGAGLLTADQETALRMKIAEMQQALGQGQLGYQYANLGQQDRQFYDNLSYLLAVLEGKANADAVTFDW